MFEFVHPRLANMITSCEQFAELTVSSKSSPSAPDEAPDLGPAASLPRRDACNMSRVLLGHAKGGSGRPTARNESAQVTYLEASIRLASTLRMPWSL